MAFALAVFRKEMIEALRDRRTIIVALVLPLLMMPVATLGIPYLAERQAAEFEDRPAAVAIVGGEHARALVDYGVQREWIRPVAVRDPPRALLARTVEAVLIIPEGFSDALSKGTAKVTIMYDETDTASRVARERLQRLVATYSVSLTEQRLRRRGLRLRDLVPIEVDERNVASKSRLGGLLLAGLLPFFIAVWAVLGGQYAALDVGAGEKERRTIEALLVTPPPRWTLAAGKFLAITVAGLGAVLVVISVTLLTLRLGAAMRVGGLDRTVVEISSSTGVLLVVTALMLVAFLSAVELALSLVARSVREAQQYFTPVYLLFTLPAMAAQFLEGWARSSATYLLPGLNTVFALRGLLLGEWQWTDLALAVLSTAVYTVPVLWFCARVLGRDAVVGRS